MIKKKLDSNRKNNPLILNLLDFLDQSPTAWHATQALATALIKQGFEELKEDQSWQMKPKKGYFVTGKGSSLCAFITPVSLPKKVRLLASHSDSPGLKLKPHPQFHKLDMLLLGVEIYGSPLLSSWLNRDLGLAGQVIYYNSKNQIKSSLVKLEEDPFIIPQLAIHLDREVNEKGLILNKQEHLNVLASIHNTPFSSSYLKSLLQRQIDLKELLHFDLFFYPLEKARLIGYQQQMLASYRIDNLASLHASYHALTSNSDPLDSDIKMLVCWDHEEIGSNTSNGAGSPFLSQILERILLSYELGREAYFKMLHKSECLSIDMAHAVHPSFIEKHDPQHQPLLGKGIVLKTNAQHRYTSDPTLSASIKTLAEKHKIPLQSFVSRNEIPCGTTIGPIHASRTGMSSIDLGCPQLSMHSSREILACSDQVHLYQLLQLFLT